MAVRDHLHLANCLSAMLATAALEACADSDRGQLKRDSGIGLRADDELALVGDRTHDGYRAIVRIAPRTRDRVLHAIYDASAGTCREMITRTGECFFKRSGRCIFVVVRPHMVVVDVQ